MWQDCAPSSPLASCASGLLLPPTAYSLQPRGGRRRAGITLLEVLISMFVLLVGLLGVASLIPVGKFEMQRGVKADRASACGRAAFREIKVRGMMNPYSWAQADAPGTAAYTEVLSGTQFIPQFDLNDSAAAPTNLRAFVIDPLGVGNASGPGSLGYSFPWSGNPTAVPSAPFLPRMTLGPGMAGAARLAMADSIFRNQDDLAFNLPGNSDQLPAQILQGGARRLSQGDYSWLATVVPDMTMLARSSNISELPLRVSVAVFYKRSLIIDSGGAAEGERMARIDISAPMGTGELTLTTNGVSLLAADPSKHLEIARPGQWLLIAGFSLVDITGDGNPDQVWNYHWYRIVSASEITLSGGNYTRAVTLAGAEWVVPPPNVTVFLFDGVIGVFEKNLKLELNSRY